MHITKYQNYLFLLAACLLCAGCQNYKKKSSAELIEFAHKKMTKKQYRDAAKLMFIAFNRNPISNKDIGIKACEVSLYDIIKSNHIIHFAQQHILDIVATCNRIIALDKKYAIENNVYLYKIYAQVLLIKPHPDFNQAICIDILKEIERDNVIILNDIKHTYHDYTRYSGHVGKNDQYTQQDVLLAEIYYFIQHMQNTNEYLKSLTKKHLNQSINIPSLSTIAQLDNIVESYNGKADSLILSMSSLLLKLIVLAQIGIEMSYIESIYDEMQIQYTAAISRKILNNERKNKCQEILKKAQQILSAYDHTSAPVTQNTIIVGSNSIQNDNH